jgi:hypothetical protein
MIDAESLNQHCQCRTLDANLLRRHLEADPQLHGLVDSLKESRPSLFAATAVFLSHAAFSRIRDGIHAIERVIALPGFRDAALTRAPEVARHDTGPLGVFTSYDFHIGASGPRLIEINSNAGGALLAAALAQAQQACCEPMCSMPDDVPAAGGAAERFFGMFLHEWELQRGAGAPGRLLIVDDDPATQYLAAEFELFRRLFERHGIASGVVDPGALEWRSGRLWHGGDAVDMVYNRLTDFSLQQSRHAALREAWLAGAVVLTPHPRTHALHADKRNLVSLGDDALLNAWGVSPEDRAVLRELVPACTLVDAANAGALWARRKSLFFKPAAGFGSKAAWRGDKLTRRVWAEVVAGQYLAQEFVPPTERLVRVEGASTRLKFDLRAYTYGGDIQLLIARMYAGQTTNFRTPGGGFAAVVVLPEVSSRPRPCPSSLLAPHSS